MTRLTQCRHRPAAAPAVFDGRTWSCLCVRAALVGL